MTPVELDGLVSGRGRNWLLLSVVATIVAMIGVNIYLLQRDRAELLERSQRTQRELVGAIASRMQSTLQKADLLTTLLAQDYLRARAEGNEQLFRPALARVMSVHPDLALAVIADQNGNPLTGSLLQLRPTFTIADRDYFRYHQQHDDDEVHVGASIVSRAAHLRIIPVSRRISDAQGRFVGVVMVGIAADPLERDIAGAIAGPNSLIGIAHTDGTVLLRVPAMGAVGRNVKRDPQFSEHYDLHARGTFDGVSPVDGQRRHYAYQVLDGYPMVVISAVGEADPLVGWRDAMLLKSGYLLLASLMLGTLAVYLYRQQRQRGHLLGLNHAILNSTACGIVAIGTDGKVLMFNRAAARMLGCRRSEGYARPPALMHVPQDLRAMLALGEDEPLPAHVCYRRVLDAAIRHPRPEWMLQRANGERFPATLTVTLVRDRKQEEIGHVLVFDDLSREKLLDRMKNDFVSVVSHELRTPLTAINGAIAILDATLRAQATPQQAKLLSMASEGCARLIRIVSDILDLDKLERGQMQLHRERQPLMPVLEDALRQNETYASQHEVNCRLIDEAGGPLVDVDRDRLLQVMANLLSNAAKFSRAGGEVRIRVTQVDDQVQIAVEDDGAGIPAAFQSRVFERFTQSGSVATRSKGGSGLGLTIARGFVEAHGGSLSFDSVEGQGTCFFLRLPVAAGPETPR